MTKRLTAIQRIRKGRIRKGTQIIRIPPHACDDIHHPADGVAFIQALDARDGAVQWAVLNILQIQ